MIFLCDARRSIPLRDASVHCVVTSPPYFGLRDYGDPRQVGLEPTPEAYVARQVAIFREVRRVLRDDGTVWLNLGDSYASKPPGCDGVSGSSGLNGVNGASGVYRETLKAGHGTKRSTISPSTRSRLRPGLTQEQIAYVLAELARARSTSDATQDEQP